MVQFTISKRSKLPTESSEQTHTFIPRLQTTGRPVNAVKFFEDCPWDNIVNKSLMQLCLGELRRLLLHEMCKGSAVTIPGIGTLTLTLHGDIEVRNGHYHGQNVRIDGLRFKPDRKLLSDIRAFEVDQTPIGRAHSASQIDIDAILADLFAKQITITRGELENACGLVLSKHRLSDLLTRLVKEGRLIKEGRGNQTRYRLQS